ncbi:hypothetical protein IEQ34_019019 [Dendrobium chrysotoxum]|uniref:Uncharacterized protein n=1 Tax=Dendrobium chrysotoxum TaxID=161865 RepID=A0AAV7G6K2_DENCH|nr:hypothetical protein IEQ34_019019 [Dendrobium chrysotoxum]
MWRSWREKKKELFKSLFLGMRWVEGMGRDMNMWGMSEGVSIFDPTHMQTEKFRVRISFSDLFINRVEFGFTRKPRRVGSSANSISSSNHTANPLLATSLPTAGSRHHGCWSSRVGSNSSVRARILECDNADGRRRRPRAGLNAVKWGGAHTGRKRERTQAGSDVLVELRPEQASSTRAPSSQGQPTSLVSSVVVLRQLHRPKLNRSTHQLHRPVLRRHALPSQGQSSFHSRRRQGAPSSSFHFTSSTFRFPARVVLRFPFPAGMHLRELLNELTSQEECTYHFRDTAILSIRFRSQVNKIDPRTAYAHPSSFQYSFRIGKNKTTGYGITTNTVMKELMLTKPASEWERDVRKECEDSSETRSPTLSRTQPPATLSCVFSLKWSTTSSKRRKIVSSFSVRSIRSFTACRGSATMAETPAPQRTRRKGNPSVLLEGMKKIVCVERKRKRCEAIRRKVNSFAELGAVRSMEIYSIAAARFPRSDGSDVALYRADGSRSQPSLFT